MNCQLYINTSLQEGIAYTAGTHWLGKWQTHGTIVKPEWNYEGFVHYEWLAQVR